MKIFGGILKGWSKLKSALSYLAGDAVANPTYEILFDDTGSIAVQDRMVLPAVISTETYLEFYALVPDDDLGAETLFSLNQTGNPRLALKFKPNANIMQLQGKTDGGTTIDEDTATYTQFGAYAKIKVDFSGASLRLYVNDVLFHTFAHGDTMTPTLFTSNVLGSLDTSGNQSMRLGSMVKGITGIFKQSIAFKDDAHAFMCEDGDTAAFIWDNENRTWWTQATVACRPVVNAL